MKSRYLAGALIALSLAAFARAPYTYPTTFKATLNGAGEQPAVRTSATGDAQFTIDEKDSTIHYTVSVTRLSNVTGAHLHIGNSGAMGAPAVALTCNPPASGPIDGTLCSGIINPTDQLMGSVTYADLLSNIRSGNTYVNVHTKDHPDGEIRGQLSAKM